MAMVGSLVCIHQRSSPATSVSPFTSTGWGGEVFEKGDMMYAMRSLTSLGDNKLRPSVAVSQRCPLPHLRMAT